CAVDLLAAVGTGEKAGSEEVGDRSGQQHLVAVTGQRGEGAGRDEGRAGIGADGMAGGQRKGEDRQHDSRGGAQRAVPETGKKGTDTGTVHKTQHYSRNATTHDATADVAQMPT